MSEHRKGKIKEHKHFCMNELKFIRLFKNHKNSVHKNSVRPLSEDLIRKNFSFMPHSEFWFQVRMLK